MVFRHRAPVLSEVADREGAVSELTRGGMLLSWPKIELPGLVISYFYLDDSQTKHFAHSSGK